MHILFSIPYNRPCKIIFKHYKIAIFFMNNFILHLKFKIIYKSNKHISLSAIIQKI